MIYGEVKKQVESLKKGAFTTVKWNKQLKTRKGIDNKVEKITIMTSCRFGVDYANMKDTKERNGVGADGKAIVQALPWGQWKHFPYIIEHKENLYLRVTTSPKSKATTTYYKDGVEITKAEAEILCLKSEFSNSSELSVITVKMENIVSVK